VDEKGFGILIFAIPQPLDQLTAIEVTLGGTSGRPATPIPPMARKQF
jgi:hypothetical protein